MSTSRNPALNSHFRSILTRYQGSSVGGGSEGGLYGYGDSSFLYYLLLLGFAPLGYDRDSRTRSGLFGDGVDGWWWTRFWTDYQANPWIAHGVDLLTHLTLGAGITLASDDQNILDLWRKMPRLSRPGAQLAYERIRKIEGEVWLGLYPVPERNTWGVKRYARQNIQDVLCDGGMAVGYRLYDPDQKRTILVPDIAYATEHGIPECIVCISDTEDPSIRGEPSITAAIEPARQLYADYLGWSKSRRELHKLIYTWEHDPQVSGVSEPEYDDDGFVAGMSVANREGGTPTGARIFQTAGRREGLSPTRELKQAVATALHLSEFHFGDTRSSNRSNSETISDDLKDFLAFDQSLHRRTYTAILEHILPDGAEWELQIKPLDKIDTAQRIAVLHEMLDAGTITLATAARQGLLLVGVDDVDAEIAELLVQDDFGGDDLLGNGGPDDEDGLNGL